MHRIPKNLKNPQNIVYLILSIFLLAFMIKSAETKYIWYLTRISAIIALVSAFYVSTLPLICPFSSKIKKISNKSHKIASLIFILFSILHILSILIDKFKWGVVIDIKKILFIYNDNPISTAISLGVLCMYLLIFVSLSGIFSKYICKRYNNFVWRCTHKVGSIIYLIAYMHAVWIGYDFENEIIFAFFSILFVINIVFIVVNLIFISLPIFEKNKIETKTKNKHTKQIKNKRNKNSNNKKNSAVKRLSLMILFSTLLPLTITGIIISGHENNLIENIDAKYQTLKTFDKPEQGIISSSDNNLFFTDSEIELLTEINIDEDDALLIGQKVLSECTLKNPRMFETHPYYRYLLDCDSNIISILYKDTPDMDIKAVIIGGVELKWINDRIPYYNLYLKETDPLVGEIKIMAMDGKPLTLKVEHTLINQI